MQIDKKILINIDENPELALTQAAELFHSGKIFIYPTDTIYGLGGNPFDREAVKRISVIKGRSYPKQFIWLLSDLNNVMNYVEVVSSDHFELLQKLWPAPVTVILKLNERTKGITNQETAAIRIPDQKFCVKLLTEISRPLISTSVNKSGGKPLNDYDEIVNNFAQEVDAIFYYSNQADKLSSTIIDLTSEKPKLIREGSIKFVELLQKFS
jgi:L-threonylcarbamoyladenylate synthase